MDQAQPDMTTCTVCGTALRPEDRFCPSCGAPNPDHRPPSTELPPPSPPQAPTTSQPTAYTPPPAPPAEYQYGSPGSEAVQPAAPPPRGNQRTWWIIGGIVVVFFLLVCCCCLVAIAISASQDSALQRELEGVASLATPFL